MGNQNFDFDKFNTKIDAFIERNWENCVRDIGKLVRVPSVENLAAAHPDAPFGPSVRQALDAALHVAGLMGFATTDAHGYVGFADMPGQTTSTLGIIGHVDVVPAGTGWNFEPFSVTRHEGHLVGRGVADDKGPLVCALYALKFWKDAGARFPMSVRVIFGCNEETQMADVAYYRMHYPDPDFLFTPDAEFPVCYGEKGICQGKLTSAAIEGGHVVEISGGSAPNAVPGEAHAVVRNAECVTSKAPGIEIRPSEIDGCVEIVAHGKSAHASTPDAGKSAILMLVNFMLDQQLLTNAEVPYFEAVAKIAGATDGSLMGLASTDEHFGPLTLVGGQISSQPSPDARGLCITQTFDIRYPTTITPEDIENAFTALADPLGATLEKIKSVRPFLTDPQTPQIQALVEAFDQVTGSHREPFTMGGGTYAREFPRAASFGPEMPWITPPDWAGAMHGPDEAISEDQLKCAIKIYALAIYKLANLMPQA
jgi:succinyl-diaminopimelate desuccinylase